jgi:hypothetical protein
MRFRILDLVDGYGRHWYRPQQRGWFYWKNFKDWGKPHYLPKVVEYETVKGASDFLARVVLEKKSRERTPRRSISPIQLDIESRALELRQEEERAEQSAAS